MCEKKKHPKDPSRRTFIQSMGVGVVGGMLIPGTMTPEAEAQPSITAHERDMPLNITINKKAYHLKIRPETTLVQVIRDILGLTGTKIVCNNGQCGGCTVLLDGEAVYSCHILALDTEGKEVTTIEGLMKGEELHPMQEAFLEQDGLQCGFCTPGQIMTAVGLVNQIPEPTSADIRTGMAGTLCRCAAYPNIEKAVTDGAARMKKNPGGEK